MLSPKTVLSLLKIGVGPSSSHTVGPMVMGSLFVRDLKASGKMQDVDRVQITLYGSLSLTGAGHLTDVAVLLGLSGKVPEKVTTAEIEQTIQRVQASGQLVLNNKHYLLFNRKNDIIFSKEFLSEHENALTITASDAQENVILEKTYFSIGGGFVVEKEQYKLCAEEEQPMMIEYDFQSAKELLQLCEKENVSIDEIVRLRDSAFISREEISAYLAEIWQVMQAAIMEGISTKNKDKVLPGGLHLKRRAPSLFQRLTDDNIPKDDFTSSDWLAVFAMAVNEESAAGHRVVTAPTNGSCGIIPAVLAYYGKYHKELEKEDIEKFLLTACAIGYLYRRNASISGAEAGCQAEIGASSSMAAAGLCALMGGTVPQIFSAAEIAMEHHLGMTCDPVGGLVQIPCIERNAFGANKAVMAARMAMQRDSSPVVSLDDVIETMYKTGKDMDRRYRETSQGGLAVQIKCPACQ